MDKNDPDTEGLVDNLADSTAEKEEPENGKPKRGNPYEEVQIYDTSCNKIRQARNFQVRSYEETDASGEVQMRKSVEFYVVGKNNTWKMFVPYDEFVRANPEVDLPGEPN